MAGTNDKILDTISNMTVMEVVDLISEMEEKFGEKALVVTKLQLLKQQEQLLD
jgi:ribosomal protein L7/L12